MIKYRLLSIWLILTAGGILAFWINWFGRGHYLNMGTPCYRVFENCFPLADTLLVGLMLLTAVLAWKASRLLPRLLSIIAGAAAGISELDATYAAQNVGELMMSGVNVTMILANSVYLGVFAVLLCVVAWRWSPRDVNVRDMRRWLVIVANLAALAPIAPLMFGGHRYCVRLFGSSFESLAIMVVLSATAWFWPRRGLRVRDVLRHVNLGVVLFCDFIWIGFFATQRPMGALYAGIVLAFVVAAFVLVRMAYRSVRDSSENTNIDTGLEIEGVEVETL